MVIASIIASLAASTTPPAAEVSAFWDQLVDRYRRLVRYEDIARLTQVRSSPAAGDQPAQSVERSMELHCVVESGELRVESPATVLSNGAAILGGGSASAGGSAAAGGGKNAESSPIRPLDRLLLKYNLWLAPHMALRFADQPLRGLRPGCDCAFAPVEFDRVTVDRRELVRLRLASGAGENAAEKPSTQVDLWVDPVLMLIERVETQEPIEGGGNLHTTMTIIPRRALSAAPPQASGPSISAPPDAAPGDATPGDPAPRTPDPEVEEASAPAPPAPAQLPAPPSAPAPSDAA